MRSPRTASLLYSLRQFQHHPRLGYRGHYHAHIFMFKSIVFGIAWCVAAYFLGCVLVGAVAGGIAGAADPNNESALGAV